MDDKRTLDIGNIASGNSSPNNQQQIQDNQETFSSNLPIPINTTPQAVIQNPDIAWIEATRGLQTNLLRSLQNYKVTRMERRVLADQRERMLHEVTEQYVNYLRDEARLSSQAALEARDSMLRQGLAKLRAELYTELADLTGFATVEIERVFQEHASKMTSQAIQEAYAKFVMNKILTLLEQSPS